MASSRGAGPIPIQIHHPLYATLLAPPPEEPALVETYSAAIALDHTNIYLLNWDNQTAALYDKELSELSISLRFPFFDQKFEGGVTGSLVRSGEGFLDSSIRSWHDLVGAPSYIGQEEAPDYRYIDALIHEGTTIAVGKKNVTGIGDLAFWLKGKAFSYNGFDAFWQILAEAPSGDPATGQGSGAWEGGGRLLMAGPLWEGRFSCGAGLFFPGEIKSDFGSLPLEPMANLFAAFEYSPLDRLSLLIQSTFSTSPFPQSAIYQFGWPFVEVTLGAAYRLEPSGLRLFAGLSENLNKTSPDFTLHLSLAY